MDDNKTFPEQKAPEKNTDDAFVKVGEDGSPVIPSNEEKTDKPEKSEDSPTTIGHR